MNLARHMLRSVHVGCPLLPLAGIWKYGTIVRQMVGGVPRHKKRIIKRMQSFDNPDSKPNTTRFTAGS